MATNPAASEQLTRTRLYREDADWITTVSFGGTYPREGSALCDRQLVGLAAFTALGGVDPAGVCVAAAVTANSEQESM